MTPTVTEIPLKYGLNPSQSTARVLMPEGQTPLSVRNGRPSYINVLDALRGWQLVRELKASVGLPAAASFKHVSPAGAAVAHAPEGEQPKLTPAFRKAQFIHPELDLSPVAVAYAKARSADRGASFGDFIAVSEPVDLSLAKLIRPEVSDGLIAPSFEPGALEILAAKKGGNYVVFEIDPEFDPFVDESKLMSRTEFGLTLEQSPDLDPIDESLFDHVVTARRELSEEDKLTGLVATITLRHTQSNSVCVGLDGAAIGIGAGQQSRIACTRLACDKADLWCLRQHPDIVNLTFADGLARSEKVNAADLLARSWLHQDRGQRPQTERSLLTQSLNVNGIPDLGVSEVRSWLSGSSGGVISSDAFFPFRDNLDRAAASGLKLVIQAGGSARDSDVTAAANEHGMVMCHTNSRFFLH